MTTIINNRRVMNDVCRLCLKQENGMHSIFEEIKQESQIGVFAEKITSIARVEINPTDGLPTSICHMCRRQVNQFHEFRLLVEMSDKALRSYLKSSQDQEIESNMYKNHADDEFRGILTNGNDEFGMKDMMLLVPTNEGLQIWKIDDLDPNPGVKQILQPKKIVSIKEEIPCDYLRPYEEPEEESFLNNITNCQLCSREFASLEDLKDHIREHCLSSETDQQTISSDFGCDDQNNELYSKNDSLYSKNDSPYSELSKNGGPYSDFSKNGGPYSEFPKNNGPYSELSKNNGPFSEFPKNNGPYSELSKNDGLYSKNDSLYSKNNSPYSEPQKNNSPYSELAKNDGLYSKTNSPHSKTTTPSPDPSKSLKKLLKCRYCTKSFTRISLKKHHEKCPLKELKLMCTECGQIFSKRSELRYHKGKHQKTPLTCATCNKFFANPQSFKIHMKRHTLGSRYNCETCGQSYFTNSELARHVQKHEDKRKYPCHLCETSFLSKPELNRHMKYHNGIKKFKCNLCYKSFYESGHLKVHQKVHTGERPFVCELCNKGFVTRSKLSRHVKIHQKDGDIGS